MKFKNVGRSSRTPLKHQFLNNVVGQIIGILSNPITRSKIPLQCREKETILLDLCAGDGENIDGDPSSPEILIKHHNYAKCSGLNSKVILIEKNKHTIEKLKNNIEYDSDIIIVNENARYFSLLNNKYFQIKVTSNLVVNCDPNHIHEMPMSENFIKILEWYDCLTLIITLGCNVGGLKMLPFEERQKWWNFVGSLLDVKQKNHDFLLIELLNDRSQWAYLISVPKTWSDKKENEFIKLALKNNMNVRIFSHMRKLGGFLSCCERLFNTRAERGII